MQEVCRDYHEVAVSKGTRNDNPLDHMVKCERYMSEITMVMAELPENECDKYYENSIAVLELLNKDLLTLFIFANIGTTSYRTIKAEEFWLSKELKNLSRVDLV